MNEPVVYRCPICGIAVDKDLISKRKSRGMENPDYCFDCLDSGKPMKSGETWLHPVLGRIRCVPHKGKVDENFRPLTSRGGLFMPGERVCGKVDCVRKSHVIPERRIVADPTETVLALFEAQSYMKRKTPADFVGQQGLLRGDQ